MKVLLTRNWKKPKYTIGNVFVNGLKFCNSLEDTDRGLNQNMTEEEIKSKKVYGETAIPTGTYKLAYTFSPKFKKYLPEILGVKGYSGIRIHAGNTASDSLGCLLLGKNTQVGMITNSRAYCDTFNKMLDEALKKGEECTITIE